MQVFSAPAAPGSPVRAQTGTRHVSFVDPVEPVGRKRFCDKRSFGAPLVHTSSAVTRGTPGWSRNERKAGMTAGVCVASAIAATKSSAVAVPQAWAFR